MREWSKRKGTTKDYGISLIVSFVVKFEGDERIDGDCLCRVFPSPPLGWFAGRWDNIWREMITCQACIGRVEDLVGRPFMGWLTNGPMVKHRNQTRARPRGRYNLLSNAV